MRFTSSASFSGTPEEYFTPRPNPEKEIPVDAVLSALSRASAILMLLTENGHNVHEGFTLHDSTIVDALYCIDGILQQMTTMIEHSVGIGEVAK